MNGPSGTSDTSSSTTGPTPAPFFALIGNSSPWTPSSAASVSARSVRARSRRSTLLSTVTAGTPERLSASAMKRSPGPISCSPFSTNSAASASARARSTWRCMRSVSASRGRCTPGRSTSTSCQSSPGGDAADLAARGLRLVGHDRHLVAHDPVDQRGLAGVRPARERDEAGAAHSSSSTRRWSASISPLSRLVVVAAQVQHAVDDRLGQVLGVLWADHDVSKLARPGGGTGLVDREGQHVRGPVDAAVLAVQLEHPARRHELDRQVPVLDARRREGRERGPAQLVGHVDEVDFDQVGQPCWRRACASRSAGACFSAYSL